ncbi:hypothetical protein HCUR_01039 [Holospora curviuscula]|uniref:Uncharacterized protein n=1 Tax=Holospora curviuscula TaxID=1082868 RepID=A0A2S5R834_9PROT|nr:hypothetical protein HCUR_01039 [Holospora curviuscula]
MFAFLLNLILGAITFSFSDRTHLLLTLLLLTITIFLLSFDHYLYSIPLFFKARLYFFHFITMIRICIHG